jgi:hypothetical protein
MADDTLTLKEDDGTTAHTFTKRKVDATGATLWDNPAPDDSLAGVRTLVRKSNKTRAGIVGRRSHLTIPRLNAVTGKWDHSIQVSVIANAPDYVPMEEVEDALSMAVTLHTPAINADYVVNYGKAL